MLLAVLTTLVGFLELIGIGLVIPFIAFAGKMNTYGSSNALLERVLSILRSAGIDEQYMTLALGLAFWLGITAANSAICWYQYFAFRVIYTHRARLSQWVAEALAKKSMRWYDRQKAADLSKSLMTDVNNCADFIGSATQVSGVLLRGVVLFSFFLYAQPRLALVIAASLLFCGVLTQKFVYRPLAKAGEGAFALDREMYRLSSDMVNGVREIKVNNSEEPLVEQMAKSATLLVWPHVMRYMPGFVTRAVMETLALGTVMVLLLYFYYSDGDLGNGLPILTAYALAGIRLIPNVQQAMHLLTQMRFHVPAIERVAEILAPNKLEDLEPADPTPVSFESSLQFDHIDFEYEPGRLLLSDLSFTVSKYQRVAFIGETGAGKSTIIDLILGLRRPQRGSILLDGQPVCTVKRSDWRDKIGYVAQSIYLRDASIAANVAFGIPSDEIDLKQVEQACRAASLTEFISQLPDGYQTEVGERGVRLSGGQCQRIGIARALYRDPEVVVFDEATSSLDTVTEGLVLNALNSLKGVKTLIVIAHRLQTVWDFDRVFVIDKGRLVAEGTCQELLVSSEIFRQLAEGFEGGHAER